MEETLRRGLHRYLRPHPLRHAGDRIGGEGAAGVAKQQLDTFAAELVREAEITGRVGSETTSRAQVLSERLEIDPDIRWSRTGRIQLNEEVTVTLTMDVDIGFGGLGSFPIELTAQASGRSEVYWK